MLHHRTSLQRLLVSANFRDTLSIQELREALRISQNELGLKLGVKQAAVSRMERREDIYISHLRRVIEAMGGKLVVTARFPGIDVRLNT